MFHHRRTSETPLQRLDRRNTILMILDGTLFWIGLAFLETNTVISVFLQKTSGSAALAGLAVTLMNFMPTVGHFFFGLFIRRLRSPHRFMSIVAIFSRPLILLMLPILLRGGLGPVSAWAFLGVYGLFMLADGFVGLVWTELSARTLQPQKRGMVVSCQRILSGLIGLAAGTVIRRILASVLPDAQQFAVIFAIAGVFFCLDVCALVLMRDHPDYQPQLDLPIPHMRQYVMGFIPLFRESRVFRQIMLTRILYLMGMIASPLYILYAATLNIPASWQTYLFYMPVLGQTLGGFFWAYASMRRGYPWVIRLSQWCNLLVACASVTVWLLPLPPAPAMFLISLCMALLSANTNAYIGYNNHLIDMVPQKKLASYLVLQSMLLAPFTFGSTLAGGMSQIMGYGAVFVIALGISLAGLFLSLRYFRSADDSSPS